MIGEVDPSGQAVNGLDSSLAQGSSAIGPLVGFNNNRNNKMQIFFDVCTKRQEGVKDLNLRVYPLLTQLAVEDFENGG